MTDKQDQMAERPEEAEVKTGDDAENSALAESDAAEGKSGDAGNESGDGGWKALALKHKGDAEELKRLKAELAERESMAAETGASVPPTAQPGPQYDANANYAERQAVEQEQALRQVFTELQQDAALGDTKAKAMLAMAYFQHQAQIQVVNELQFSKMPAAEADLSRRYFATGDYRTPEAARKAALGDLSVREKALLAKERKEIESDKKARESRDVTEVVTRSVSSREVAANGPMKRHQWHTAWDAAQERGDTKRLEQLMAIERRGEIAP